MKRDGDCRALVNARSPRHLDSLSVSKRADTQSVGTAGMRVNHLNRGE